MVQLSVIMLPQTDVSLVYPTCTTLVYRPQVHYNNVQRLTDRWDSSGLSLQLTDTLRQYDMATLALGPMLFSIPANTPSFSLDPSWCPSQCTQKMNATSVKMTSLVMHMHKVCQGSSARAILATGNQHPPSPS
jgi:hypothetical protein